jgi:hypothetical protein
MPIDYSSFLQYDFLPILFLHLIIIYLVHHIPFKLVLIVKGEIVASNHYHSPREQGQYFITQQKGNFFHYLYLLQLLK